LGGKKRRAAKAAVTAGLKCAPEMCFKPATMMPTASAKERATPIWVACPWLRPEVSVSFGGAQTSSEPPSHVVFGALILGAGENRIGLVELDHRSGACVFVQNHHRPFFPDARRP